MTGNPLKSSYGTLKISKGFFFFFFNLELLYLLYSLVQGKKTTKFKVNVISSILKQIFFFLSLFLLLLEFLHFSRFNVR